MTENHKLNGPRIPIDDLDYVDLWKYFEERGAVVKNTMLSVITWVVGFAAAILGFIVKELLVFDANTLEIPHPLVLIIFSGVGTCIVFYGGVLIQDYGEHINRNFHRADLAREGYRSLDQIMGDPGAEKQLPPICRRIRWVVRCFGIAFAITMILGLLTILRA